MLSMVEYVHQRVKEYPSNLIGVDMTMGNGHDTLMLAKRCQEVYAFDIQQEAIDQTRQLTQHYSHIHLIKDGHENMDAYFSSFDIGIFNLGYLPLADHHVTTLLETTQIAIKKAVELMNVAVWIVVYPGHEEGYRESQWIDEYVSCLDSKKYNVSKFQMMNKKKSPYVIEIEKRF